MRCVDGFSGGFVEVFTKLAPEAVQHEFGRGLASRVLDDEVRIEVDTFFLLVLPDVLSFVCGGDSPGRVASRLLFNFQPGVEVLSKESYFTLIGKWWTSWILSRVYPSSVFWISVVHHSPRSVRCSGV